MGVGVHTDYGKADGMAWTDLTVNTFPAAEQKMLKTLACPAGCSFIDYWLDDPIFVTTGGAPRMVKIAGDWVTGYQVTITESVVIHRDCYVKQQDAAAAEAARKAAKAEEEKEKSRKAAEDEKKAK